MGAPGLDDTVTASSLPEATTASAGLAVGAEVAGRYRVLRFVAAGGMGEVYEADDRVLDAVVALKTVKAVAGPSPAAVERLIRELALARKVTHPNVCRLHDVGEHGGRAFLTMELLRGETLAQRLRRGRLPLAELEPLARQLVAALAALHAAGVVHRDFKSANIILVGAGGATRAVVTDFGLARAMGPATDAQVTHEGGLHGTPAYMAPEQVEGRVATPASDIYALGVVLFEMATGTLPFEEDTALATATARLTREPPRARARRPELAPAWDATIARCLRRTPEARPATVGEVLEARPRRRRWWLAGIVGVAGAATAAAVLWPRPALVPAPVVGADDRACPAADRRLAGVWDPALRARVAARFEASPQAFVLQAWQAHARQFDGTAAAWARSWDRACASPDRIEDPLRHGQRLACLDTRLLELRAHVGGFVDAAIPAEDIALGSPGELPIIPAAECDLELVLRAQVPPPAPTIRAEVDALMAEFHGLRARIRFAGNTQARGEPIATAPLLDRLDALRARALELGYASGAAEIGWWLAEFLSWFDRHEDSDRVAQEVIDLATRTRDDSVLARMLADRVSHRAQFAPAYDAAASASMLAQAEVIAARLGSPNSLDAVIVEARTYHAHRLGDRAGVLATWARQAELNVDAGLPSFALRHRTRGAVLRAKSGEPALAAEEARRIFVERAALIGDRHPLLGHDLSDLAPAFARAGDLEAALSAVTRAIAIFEHVSAAHHWTLLRYPRARAIAFALALGRTAEADHHLRAAVATAPTEVGSEIAAHADLAGWLRARGLRLAAEHVVAAAARVPRTPGDDDRLATMAAALRDEALPIVVGDPTAAAAAFARARAALPASLGWRAPTRIVAEARLGVALVEAGRPADAIELLERALWVQTLCCDGAAVIAHDARFALARALWATGGDRARARALARDALTGLRAMGPALASRARILDTWLRDHDEGMPR